MIPGRTNGILFDETITHAQCDDCNAQGKGNGEKQKYKAVMVAKHGEAWYDMKLQARRSPVKLDDFALRLMNSEWLARIKKLKSDYLDLDRN